MHLPPTNLRIAFIPPLEAVAQGILKVCLVTTDNFQVTAVTAVSDNPIIRSPPT